MENNLLKRYFEGQTNEKESKKVIEWLEKKQSNIRYYHSLCRIYEVSSWLDKEHTEKLLDNCRTHTRKVFSWSKVEFETLKIAAIVICTLVVNGILMHGGTSFDSKTQVVYAPVGQHVEVALADGSTVWLNAESKLIFPTKFKRNVRNVTLFGEGYFKVKSNPKRPFIVSTKKYQIRAIGTQFNVFAYPKTNYFRTDLLKGKVEINKLNNPYNVIELNPNECTIIEKNNIVKSSIKNLDYFRWREGIICFDESLSGVFTKLELYFDVNIKITPKADIPINDLCVGKFRTRDGLLHILNVLKLSHNFRYKTDNENNIITIY